jgi:hypothetical protein
MTAMAIEPTRTRFTPDEFRQAAADMTTAMEELAGALTRFLEQGDRLVAMAGENENGGLPRLGVAVRAESASLMAAFRDLFNAKSVEEDLPVWEREVGDLRDLVELASGTRLRRLIGEWEPPSINRIVGVTADFPRSEATEAAGADEPPGD